MNSSADFGQQFLSKNMGHKQIKNDAPEMAFGQQRQNSLQSCSFIQCFSAEDNRSLAGIAGICQKARPGRRLYGSSLGLHGGHGDSADNIRNRTATGHVVDRSGQPLHYHTCYSGTSNALDQFVTDITAIEIRKN
jgi:hypothetical protein